MRTTLQEWLPNIITAIILALIGWWLWGWLNKKDDGE
jgi:hypothetical protein